MTEAAGHFLLLKIGLTSEARKQMLEALHSMQDSENPTMVAALEVHHVLDPTEAATAIRLTGLTDFKNPFPRMETRLLKLVRCEVSYESKQYM